MSKQSVKIPARISFRLALRLRSIPHFTFTFNHVSISLKRQPPAKQRNGIMTDYLYFYYKLFSRSVLLYWLAKTKHKINIKHTKNEK